jgi:hypothetical protein
MLKNTFTIVSLILGLLIYVPYFLSIVKKQASPHIFSWFTWGLLTGLGFILSLTSGGGQGAWVFGLESFLCFMVALYALFQKEKNITRSDQLVFGAALIITIFYIFTKNAVISVILAAVIDGLGFIPTFRKSYLKPNSEPLLSYLFSSLAFLFSLGALNTYNFVTVFYAVALAVTNSSLIIFLIARRKITSP